MGCGENALCPLSGLLRIVPALRLRAGQQGRGVAVQEEAVVHLCEGFFLLVLPCASLEEVFCCGDDAWSALGSRDFEF